MKRIVMIIMAAALVALPTMAQQDQWQSTSTMQGATGYTAPVTAVGSASAISVATTTESYSPAQAPNGPRKIGPTHGEDNPNPIGDAVLPLMLMALGFCGVMYYRRKKVKS